MDYGGSSLLETVCIRLLMSYNPDSDADPFLEKGAMILFDYLGKSSDTDSSSPVESLLSRSRW
ncbi:hypothetical protein CCACVL1_27239 [Corchorus capsularis]|uniref:Uncharacterized protein n=1 Tax=Corchorus capsularis TaxID=210143 RepID=A0A1R3GBM0_COCAP|nr:hypothetical protein CCACVL1_27239 [Corchorus capsularis]